MLREQPPEVRADMRAKTPRLVENNGVLLAFDEMTGTTVTVVQIPDAEPVPDDLDQQLRLELAVASPARGDRTAETIIRSLRIA